jgi:hypothetical protein
MTAIPKGSSLIPRDAAMLGGPSVLRHACLLCGIPFPDSHHEPPRGRIPKALQPLIPRPSLCGPGNTAGTCHGMAHRNGGTVRIEATDAGYTLVLDEQAQLRVNVRRAAHGLPPVLSAIDIEGR